VKTNVDAISEPLMGAILGMMTQVEHVSSKFIDTDVLRGFEEAKKVVEIGAMPHAEESKHKPTIWASLSCGRNHILNAHRDDDFFLSATMVLNREALDKKRKSLKMDVEICSYFVFPGQGKAVALRPGDILLFNPNMMHCISSRTVAYKEKDVYCISFYLKTSVVGKNDNSLELTEEERTFDF
jgi:hypothetical protein